MIFKSSIYGFILLCLLEGLPITAFSDETVVIAADQVTPIYLCGALKREIHFGPPGFGETPKIDARKFVWIVDLFRPAVFRHKSDNGKFVEEELKAIQVSLASKSLERQLYRAMGRPIVITGPIWSASSEGDVTPVVIEFSSIASFDKSVRCTN